MNNSLIKILSGAFIFTAIGLFLMGLVLISIPFLLTSATLAPLVHELVGPEYDSNAQLLLFVFAALIIVYSILTFVVGLGLWKTKPWARMPALIISVLMIFSFPIGTAVGIIGLITLLPKKTANLFKEQSNKKRKKVSKKFQKRSRN